MAHPEQRGPGQTQQLTPSWVEQASDRFSEQLQLLSLHWAVAREQVGPAGMEPAQVAPGGAAVGVGLGVGAVGVEEGEGLGLGEGDGEGTPAKTGVFSEVLQTGSDRATAASSRTLPAPAALFMTPPWPSRGRRLAARALVLPRSDVRTHGCPP